MNPLLYTLGSRLVLLPLRPRPLRAGLAWWAKVVLRHARVVGHLERAGYDAVVDGGASVGEFAALVRIALPRAQLVCVEPHPPSADVLRRRGFTVVEAALWRQEGTTRLSQPTPASTSCTIVGEAGVTAPAWTVRTVRLDRLGVEGQRVLVKLDLQGAELDALEGMDGLWDRCVGVLTEVSYGEAGSYEPLRARLVERGYREAATLNELETGEGVAEADKLFLRPGVRS